jgi:hypothetical protein
LLDLIPKMKIEVRSNLRLTVVSSFRIKLNYCMNTTEKEEKMSDEKKH